MRGIFVKSTKSDINVHNFYKMAFSQNSSSLTMRSIEEIDKECSEIWSDWIPYSTQKSPKQTDFLNFSQEEAEYSDSNEMHDLEKRLKKSPKQEKTSLSKKSTSSQKSFSKTRDLTSIKEKQRENIIKLSREIAFYKKSNKELESELSILKQKYEESRNNIPDLYKKITQSRLIQKMYEENHEEERKRSVFDQCIKARWESSYE